MLALQAVTPPQLAQAAGIPEEDARKVVGWVHQRGTWPHSPPPSLRRTSREAVQAQGDLPTLEAVGRADSQLDPFVKLALRCPDGREIETVRIPLERPHRYTVCVSSQVGCALACAFCATGLLGLRRNLAAWEIIEQVRWVRRTLAPPDRVHGVVFQGMGEPLANPDAVLQAIAVLSEPSAQAIDRRNITVCTAGIAPGIRRMATERPEVRIGWSIGDLRPGRRAELMPIEHRFPVAEVLDALEEHARRSRLAPLWAYTLLAGQNDSEDAALALAETAAQFAERTGVRPRISIIPYNHVDGAPWERTAASRQEAFRQVLHTRGVGSVLRYSGGGDVGAACGQLARGEAGGRRLASRPEAGATAPAPADPP